MAFCCGGSRWIPDHTTRRICTDPHGGEIAAIRGDVVMALPAATHVVRVNGKQDRRLELASVRSCLPHNERRNADGALESKFSIVTRSRSTRARA
jgi:hypothetical protein